MTTPSRLPAPPEQALTRNVLRAILRAPQLNKIQLQFHLDVLLEGIDPQCVEHQQAVQSARTIIQTIAIQEQVIRTPEQLRVLESEPRLLGLVQELLLEVKDTASLA
ncbi:hypothetical protein [Deinococcus sp. QL22]|uniref:hypothetical protein n=1 Tax=Deinococcus sp. QL22 TaxID=2939437 RepID=UPI0020180B90|nr:hypothetical protein [Deinococcus sp. QL22]UQN10192.1 hypothetical protein M1R55_27840 [Deinococcus sp. QL22]